MVLAGSRQAGLRWVEFGRSGGADVGTLSPVLPSVLLDGGARGDRGAERVCVCECYRDAKMTNQARMYKHAQVCKEIQISRKTHLNNVTFKTSTGNIYVYERSINYLILPRCKSCLN